MKEVLSGHEYKDEADFQRAFNKWGDVWTVLGAGGFGELKFTRGTRMGFNDRDIKVHQRDSLMRAGWGVGLEVCAACKDVCGAGVVRDVVGRGLRYKISDASPELKPFDCFWSLGGVSGWIVIAFESGAWCVAIEIWAFEKMRCALKSGGGGGRNTTRGIQSCTFEDCVRAGGIKI